MNINDLFEQCLVCLGVQCLCFVCVKDLLWKVVLFSEIGVKQCV